MKSYIKIYSLLLATMTVAFTGCLKDKEFKDGTIQSLRSEGAQKIIEIGLTATNTNNYQLISMPNINRDTTFNLVPVVLASTEPASTDIQVVLTLNEAAIGAWNDISDPKTAHEQAPASTYTILNPPATGGGWIVTIPKGSNVGYLRATVNPAADFLGNDFALGFRINRIETSGYLISSNLSTGVVAIGIKNDYEGEYEVTGYFQHPTVPRPIDQEEYLKTAGAFSLQKTLGDLTGTNIIITLDPVTNKVTIAPGPGTSGTTAAVEAVNDDPTYNNTYDPVTKTFWLKYAYPMPAPTRIITEKIQLIP